MKNTVSYDVWRGVKIFRAIKFSDVEPALALTLHPDLIYLFLPDYISTHSGFCSISW